MTTKSIVTNVALSIDDIVVKPSGTYLVTTGGDGRTTIEDQDTGETFDVEILHSNFGSYTLLSGEAAGRTLTLGAVPRANKADCGCGKRSSTI